MRKFKVVSIVLVCFFALAFTACDNGVTIGTVDGAGGGGGAAGNPPITSPGSPSLTINQPVYLLTQDANGFPVLGGRLSGTHMVSGNGAAGTISGGNLEFTTGSPQWLSPIAFFFPDGATFQPDGVQVSWLGMSTGGTGLLLEHISHVISGNNISEQFVQRRHIYVSSDVVVTRPHMTQPVSWVTRYGVFVSGTATEQAFTLNLRAGWNVFHLREVGTVTFAGTWPNPTSVTGNVTTTTSIADPGHPLRWRLGSSRQWHW